jgi:hypothetical protein
MKVLRDVQNFIRTYLKNDFPSSFCHSHESGNPENKGKVKALGEYGRGKIGLKPIFEMTSNDSGLEMVDIVDEHDAVLYQTTKHEAHEKGLLHRTVIAEVRDTEGRWILTQQSSERQDPGQYVSPVGGHVRAGESVENALKREAMEECGLKDFKFSYVGKAVYNRFIKNRQENHYFIMYDI